MNQNTGSRNNLTLDNEIPGLGYLIEMVVIIIVAIVIVIAIAIAMAIVIVIVIAIVIVIVIATGPKCKQIW